MRHKWCCLVLAALVIPTISSRGWGAEASTAKVAPLTLNDYHGQAFDLTKAADGNIVVLAFLGTECPLAKLYAPRLAELAKEYKSRGVVFVGIDSIREDAATE